jgi:hypothetical protein
MATPLRRALATPKPVLSCVDEARAWRNRALPTRCNRGGKAPQVKSAANVRRVHGEAVRLVSRVVIDGVRTQLFVSHVVDSTDRVSQSCWVRRCITGAQGCPLTFNYSRPSQMTKGPSELSRRCRTIAW